MMTQSRVGVIAPQLEDEIDPSIVEFHENLEQIQFAVTPDPTFDFIHVAHREYALDAARAFNQSQLEKLQLELAQGQRLLEAKKALTRRGEFTTWRNSLFVTLSEARKYMSLVSTFGGWAIEKLMAIASATNIYALCQTKYVEVVEQLRCAEFVTKEYVQCLVKEVRAKTTKTKKKAPSVETEDNNSVLEQHIDLSCGGFYYTLKSVNLSEDVGSKLKVELETKSIGQVLAQAVTPSTADLEVKRVRQELKEAVDEMRDVQIHLQQEIIQSYEQLKEKDVRIENLEAELRRHESDFPDSQKHAAGAALSFRETGATQAQQPEPPRTSLEDFNTWEEFADFVNCKADQLTKVVQPRSASERQYLSKILSQFLEREPQGFNTINWLPEKLVAAACRYLSFNVERLSGEKNLIDDPTIETVLGCKFVSVRDFGTQRECWVFQLPDRKNIPIFGREQFQVERQYNNPI